MDDVDILEVSSVLSVNVMDDEGTLTKNECVVVKKAIDLRIENGQTASPLVSSSIM